MNYIKNYANFALGVLLLNSCSLKRITENTQAPCLKSTMEHSELIPSYNLNLDNIESHIISAEIFGVEYITSLELLVYDNQGQECYSQSIQNPKIKNNQFSLETPSILFLPDSSKIELFENNHLIADTLWTHDIIKTILIDRNGVDERLYMIEGDQNFLFGRLENNFNVSTGLYLNQYRHTPLGYWHVRSKSEYYINQGQGWVMPWALWYFDNTNDLHPANGIHEGFSGTPYGIPVSHGCTRVPEEHAENLWNWAPIGTSVIYIDSTYHQTCYLDKDYFNIAEYDSYKTILTRLLYDQIDFSNNNYLIFSKDNSLTALNELSHLINQSCNTWTKPDSSFVGLLEQVAKLYTLKK